MTRLHTLCGAVSAAVTLQLASVAHADQVIGIDALPPPVRATVERETQGLPLLEIERDDSRTGVVYEVEYMRADQRWELEVAEDGRVISHDLD